MTLPEYYQYLKQLPQQAMQMLQEQYSQKDVPKPATYKKKLVRKTFSNKRKP